MSQLPQREVYRSVASNAHSVGAERSLETLEESEQLDTTLRQRNRQIGWTCQTNGLCAC